MTEEPSRRLFGESPPQQCVLTDSEITKVINIDDGFPLPENGGLWQWVGGWRVDKRVSVGSAVVMASPKHKIDCDDDGWSYSESHTNFVINPTELCWDNPKFQGRTVLRPWRRRKWTRQRALLSYPYASERSKHYLRLLAENERNTIITFKLSDQLVDTKTKLTETEEEFLTTKDKLSRELESLRGQLQIREGEMYRMIEVGLAELASRSDDKGLKLSNQSTLVDQLGKEGVEKVMNLLSTVVSTSTTAISSAAHTATQSLRKPDEKPEGGEDGNPQTEEIGDTDTKQTAAESKQSFDWKMIASGGGALIEKIKASPAGTAVLQGIARHTGKEKHPVEEMDLPTLDDNTAENTSTTAA